MDLILIYAETFLKILLAFICGVLIGFDREIRDRQAGMKTNMLVTVGACLFTIISITFGNVDTARIAAQIVSGIGFLGAGAIIKEGFTVKGLTTAAMLWVAAAIGMAIGAGQFIIGIYATIVIIFGVIILRRFEKYLKQRIKNKK